jgi:hypothetical protein
LALASGAQAGFVAYNDLAGGSTGNVTMIQGLGGQSGTLVDYGTGASTGVTLTVDGSNTTITSLSNAYVSGSPAEAEFTDAGGDILDPSFFVGYIGGDFGGGQGIPWLDFTFTGLDPSLPYEVIISGGRDGWGRDTVFSITDYDSFNENLDGTNGKSNYAGASSSSQKIVTGSFGVYGEYAGWDGVMSGSDGDFTLSARLSGSYEPKFYLGVLKLTEVPEPMTILVLGGGLLALIRRR